ncbi:uncharacterized protein BXZ73DRAFT_41854, partial [Epithele typhae]|uniref:uncharacterized protein n=1 Tax=Epithele typhae TaxID=378194 RepID=UPI00200879F0
MVASPDVSTNLELIGPLYETLTTSLERAGYLLEHEKTEGIHFIPTHSAHCPHATRAIPLPGLTTALKPPSAIRHLGFLLDSRLNWRAHVNHYAHRARTTTAASHMLGSSARGINPSQRRLLYTSCIRPVLTYGCQ